MSELEDKLNSILSDPKAMQQIMNLAQSLNTGNSETNSSGNNSAQPAKDAGLSPSMLGKVSSLLQKGSIDKNQQTLLHALSPYLSKNKILKLERAMQAARMAGMASELLHSGTKLF